MQPGIDPDAGFIRIGQVIAMVGQIGDQLDFIAIGGDQRGLAGVPPQIARCRHVEPGAINAAVKQRGNIIRANGVRLQPFSQIPQRQVAQLAILYQRHLFAAADGVACW